MGSSTVRNFPFCCGKRLFRSHDIGVTPWKAEQANEKSVLQENGVWKTHPSFFAIFNETFFINGSGTISQTTKKGEINNYSNNSSYAITLSFNYECELLQKFCSVVWYPHESTAWKPKRTHHTTMPSFQQARYILAITVDVWVDISHLIQIVSSSPNQSLYPPDITWNMRQYSLV